MIDRAEWDIGATLIEQYRNGLISNDEFSDRWPLRADDRALQLAFWDTWGYSNDTREHRLVGKDRPSDAMLSQFSRWALFLRSGQQLQWPRFPEARRWRIVAGGIILAVTALIAAACLDLMLAALLGAGLFMAMLVGTGVLVVVIMVSSRRERQRRRGVAWRDFMAVGDIAVYPFLSLDDLLAAGGTPDLRAGRCLVCGYDLAGVASAGCPECGAGPG